MTKVEELRSLLESVDDSYDDFVEGGIMEAESDEGYADRVIGFIKANPNATSSDIIRFETEHIFGIKPISN